MRGSLGACGRLPCALLPAVPQVFVQKTSAGKTAEMLSCLFQPVTLADDGLPEDLSLAPDPAAAAAGLDEAEQAYGATLQEEEKKLKQIEAKAGFAGAMKQLGADLRAGSPRYDKDGNPVGLQQDGAGAPAEKPEGGGPS